MTLRKRYLIACNMQLIVSLCLQGENLSIRQVYSIFKLTWNSDYRDTYNTTRALEGNKIVDHSDVVGASIVSAVPTTSSFST